MFKFIKEWLADYNEIQKELNRSGLFTVYHQFGAYTQYIEPPTSTHINTSDDRQNTISSKNK